MTKKSRQKFKYLKSEKSFKDEIKNFFHHLMSFHWSKLKTIFSEGWEPGFKLLHYKMTKLCPLPLYSQLLNFSKLTLILRKLKSLRYFPPLSHPLQRTPYNNNQMCNVQVS